MARANRLLLPGYTIPARDLFGAVPGIFCPAVILGRCANGLWYFAVIVSLLVVIYRARVRCFIGW